MIPHQKTCLTMSIPIKISYNGELRRFLCAALSFAEVAEAVKSMFPRVGSSFAVKYEDEEAEQISLSSDLELREALNLCRQLGRKTLKLFVSTNDEWLAVSPIVDDNAPGFRLLADLVLKAEKPEKASEEKKAAKASKEAFQAEKEAAKAAAKASKEALQAEKEVVKALQAEKAAAKAAKLAEKEAARAAKQAEKEARKASKQSRKAEKAEPEHAEAHRGVCCDSCGMSPIIGARFKCSVCADFDLCEACEQKEDAHRSDHPLLKLRRPIPAPAAQVQDVVHDGVCCNDCNVAPVRGVRFKCSVCPDFDLCEACEQKDEHPHVLIKMRKAHYPPQPHGPRWGRWGGKCRWSDAKGSVATDEEPNAKAVADKATAAEVASEAAEQKAVAQAEKAVAAEKAAAELKVVAEVEKAVSEKAAAAENAASVAFASVAAPFAGIVSAFQGRFATRAAPVSYSVAADKAVAEAAEVQGRFAAKVAPAYVAADKVVVAEAEKKVEPNLEEVLQNMGFTDRARNLALLEAHHNDLQRIVGVLLGQ